jgi:hypothetical protein
MTGGRMTDPFDPEKQAVVREAEETTSVRLLGSPPVLLWAVASLAISAVLLLAGGIFLNVLGYVFACLVPFTLVALYRRTSTQRMAISGVVPPAWVRSASSVIIGVGFGLALAHAWMIASGIA